MFKKMFLALGVLAFTAFSAQAALQVGEAAPGFEGVNVLTGETIKLSDLKGKKVVLEWTNHKCPFVRKHYDSGNMQKTQSTAINDYDVTWITIVSSAPGKQGHVDPQEAVQIVEEEGASPDVKILDESGEIGKRYEARTTPHMFVIDEEGKLVYKGAIDDKPSPRQSTIEGATNYVLVALEDLRQGNPVESASTAPYGCAVKY